MAGHVPAFTQHTQLFHRHKKAEIHPRASCNSMHPQGKKLTTLAWRQKIASQNAQNFSAHAVEKQISPKYFSLARSLPL